MPQMHFWPPRVFEEMAEDGGAGGDAVVNLIVEAEQSIQEVSYALDAGVLSKTLPSTPSCAYINLTTKESKEMTVRLSLRGFEVSLAVVLQPVFLSYTPWCN